MAQLFEAARIHRRLVPLVFLAAYAFCPAWHGEAAGLFDEPESRLFTGVSAGWAHNTLAQNGAENYAYWTTWNAGNGISCSLPVRYYFFNSLAIQAEPSYIQKNYVISRNPPGFPVLDGYITNHFVNLPVMMHFSIETGIENLRVFANAGAFAGYWAAGHRKGSEQTVSVNAYENTGSIFEYDEPYEFDSRADNRFEYGLIAGGGVQYALPVCAVYLEFRSHWGLSDLQKPYYTHYFAPKKNMTWTLQLGVLIDMNSILNL